MKKVKIAYWIITGLFGAFMIFSSVGDIMVTPETVEFMRNLGYPDYFTPFIGWAKILGVIGIIVPGFPRIKEWAYAGLMYDLIGATYSNACVGPFPYFMILPIGFCVASYLLYHKLQKAKLATA